MTFNVFLCVHTISIHFLCTIYKRVYSVCTNLGKSNLFLLRSCHRRCNYAAAVAEAVATGARRRDRGGGALAPSNPPFRRRRHQRATADDDDEIEHLLSCCSQVRLLFLIALPGGRIHRHPSLPAKTRRASFHSYRTVHCRTQQLDSRHRRHRHHWPGPPFPAINTTRRHHSHRAPRIGPWRRRRRRSALPDPRALKNISSSTKSVSYSIGVWLLHSMVRSGGHSRATGEYDIYVHNNITLSNIECNIFTVIRSFGLRMPSPTPPQS